MKLKKSYILLIVMSIFLLISIGSAFANENLTDDGQIQSSDEGDVELANDGENVVLSDDSDTAGNVPDDTNQEKVNTTIETGDDTFKFGQDADKNIPVEVKANKTDNVNINKTDLSIFEGNKTISFEYNNTIVTIKDVLSVGNHTLTVNYLGNENYTSSFKNITVQVFGNNTIETETSVVCNGELIEIPVKVHDGVDYIELIAQNFNLTLVYTNENGNISNLTISDFKIINGTITFNNTDIKLIAASLIVNYANATEPKTVGIKISTEVKAEADKDKFESEEIKNISITIEDGKGNLINVNKNDLNVFENGKKVEFAYNNTKITINSLTVGNHTLTIVYNGNETYVSSNKTVIVKVSGNKTINPDKTVSLDENKNVNFTLNLSDGVDPQEINKDNLTLILFFKNGNITTNRTLSASEIEISGQNIIIADISESFESAYIDIAYRAERNLTGKTVLKVGTEITASDFQKGASEVKNFTVEVKDSNGNILNISSKDLKVLKDGKEAKFTYNNSVVTLTDAIDFGVYNITVKYVGNDTFADAVKDIKLTVYGINATKQVDINSTKTTTVKVDIFAGNESVDFDLSDVTLNVTYKNGNDTVEIPISSKELVNGSLIITLENGNFTKATLTIRYNSTEANVTLNRIYKVKIIPVTVSTGYQDGNFTFQVIDIDTNSPLVNQSVSIEGKNSAGTQLYFITKSGTSYSLMTSLSVNTDEEGIATLVNKDFYPGMAISDAIYAPVGTYNLTVKGANGVKGQNATTVTIEKIDVKIVMNKFSEYYGTDKKVTIKVTNKNTGKAVSGVYVYLTIKDATLSTPNQMTDVNGTIQLGVSVLPGNTYSMTFKSNDTNINDANGTGSFTIKKIPLTVSAKDVTVQYNTGNTYTFKATKNGKGVEGVYFVFKLYTTSKKYETYLVATDKKGQVSFSAPLNVGKHKIIISSADSRYSTKDVTKTITVKKASATLKAPKVTDYYKGAKYLTIKVINSKNKKAIYAAKLDVKIFVSKTKALVYKASTGSNGVLKIPLDNLNPKTYKVVISGNDNKNFAAKQITTKIVIKKAPTKLTPTKLTAKKGAKKYFQIKVTNKKTKKVIKGVKVKVKVYTGKKYKTYTLKTNAKGIAKLNTKSLKVGTHKVVVTSANKYCVASKATSTIKIKK